MNRSMYTFLWFAILTSVSCFSQPKDGSMPVKVKSSIKSKEIAFIESSLLVALRKAKAEGKYIFVDAYATWCGPCKQLKLTTFKDSRAADFFNKNFINLSVDMEKSQGLHLTEKWEVQEYPTLLLLDQNGNVLSRSTGYLDAAELIAFGNKAYR